MIKKLFTKSQLLTIANKELYIIENQAVWIQKGSIMRHMRKEAGFTVKQMAMYLKVSPGRLYRFESGKPVKDARLIEAAYLNVLRYEEVKVLLTKASDFIKEDEKKWMK